MNKLILTFATFLIAASLLRADANVGNAAPNFSVQDANGKMHKLADYKGKIIVLEAYNLDCPFCANHYKTGAMQELQADLTLKGVVWLTVNSSNPRSGSYRNPEAAKAEIKEHGIKASAYLLDSTGALGKAYGLKTTPHMIIVAPDGKIAYNGAIDDSPNSEGDPRKARNYVREAVEHLSKGEPVDMNRTKPYGCGVKYAN